MLLVNHDPLAPLSTRTSLSAAIRANRHDLILIEVRHHLSHVLKVPVLLIGRGLLALQ